MSLFKQYLSTYILHFGLVLLFLIVFILVGSLVRSLFFKKNKLSIYLVDIFPNLFMGLVIVVTFFSLFITQLKSINFLFLVVGLGFLYDRNSFLQLDFSAYEHKNHKYVFLLFFIFIFSLLFHSIYQYNYEIFTAYRWDDIFYANLAYHIAEQGLENTSHVANLVNENISLNYYHYFELWLTSFFFKFSDQNIITLFILYTSTVIIFSAFLALYYFLVTEVKLSSIQLSALLFILGFISITTFPFYENIFGHSLFYGIKNIFLGHDESINIKSTLLLLPICIGLQFLRKNYLFFTAIIISVLTVFSVVMLPFAFISTSLLVLYALLKSREELKKIVIYSFVFYTFFIAFYYFQGALSGNTQTVSFSIYKELYFRTRITLSLTIKVFIYFAPYFILIILFCKKNIFLKEKRVIILYLIVVASTAFMATFFYKQINYLQIANLINYNFTKIIIIYLLAKIITVEAKLWKSIVLISSTIVLTIIVSSWMFNHLYFDKTFIDDKKFEKQVKVFFKQESNIDSYFGVYISTPTKLDPYNIVSIYNSPFVYISTIQSGVSLLSLSHIDIPNPTKDPIDSLNFEIGLRSDPFYKFIQKQKQQDVFKSLNQSRYDFITQYRPYFIAVKKEEDIPELLRPILGERIENKSAKIILYRFKYE
ncbi:hypothetical protein WAF17_01495 [Bernardetia sp. ABR2-2B]|uniref:hypothetical protein n=1 Tax=Bernardetia sp. ABR2-2B TaxID=3127472 RepID=UPI0030CF6434